MDLPLTGKGEQVQVQAMLKPLLNVDDFIRVTDRHPSTATVPDSYPGRL